MSSVVPLLLTLAIVVAAAHLGERLFAVPACRVGGLNRRVGGTP
jgi:hypothetical protein